MIDPALGFYRVLFLLFSVSIPLQTSFFWLVYSTGVKRGSAGLCLLGASQKMDGARRIKNTLFDGHFINTLL
jgi:hypothetical protein